MIPAMDHHPYSPSWLASWRDDITHTVDTLLPAFEETYGYPPGRNEIRPATGEDLRAAREYAQEPLVFGELRMFYESFAEVSLPDIGNGFFIHPAHAVLAQLATEGPVFASGADDPHGMVIASNGGGALYVADRGGAIHRPTLQGEFVEVAGSFPKFLDQVRRHVVRFAESGSVNGL
ncbi:hypothetical protein F3K43_26470 [Streptomyces sp. LBUM 1476]|nr:hypothetical protein [Streptomyces sp. LBUM 1476]MBZ3910242.1 hypothetical protein [Streptomyces acidiscabies]GAV43952.1 hypothetical protein Saa2_06911 [Streptomyces acidiscabies]